MHKQEAPQKPSDNVIAFPRKNINGPPVSVEEMKQLIEDNKTEVIELFVEELTREIFTITANIIVTKNTWKSHATLQT